MAFDIRGRIRIDSRDVSDASQNFGELRNRMRALADEIPGLGQGLAALESLFGGLRVGSGGSATALLSVGVAAGAAAVALSALGIAAAFSWVDQIGEMNDLGDKLGIAGDQAYYLNQAMTGAGLSVSILLTAQDKLAKSMTKSGDESKGAGLAFERLGIATEDANGKLLGTDAVLASLTEKYKGQTLSATEAADISLVLGKNYREVMFATDEAAKAQAVYNEMVEAGIGTSDAASAAEDEMAKQHLRSSGVISQMGSILVEMVIPAWNELTSWFVKSYKEGGGVAQAFNLIANSTKVVIEVISFLSKLIGSIIESFILLGSTGISIMKGIGQALTLDFSGGLSTINGAIDGFGKKLHDIGLRQIGIIKDGVIGIATSTANLLTNKDVVGEARAGMLAKTGGIATSIVPVGGKAGGTVNAVKEKKEGKSDEEKAAEAAEKAIESLIKTLNGQAYATEGLNKVQLVGKELEDKRYAVAPQRLKDRALEVAGIIDEANATKILTEANKAVAKASKDYVNLLSDEVKFRGMNKRDIAEILELRKEDATTQSAINKLRESGLWSLEKENALLEKNKQAKQDVQAATAAAKEQDDDWLGNGVARYTEGLGTIQKAAEDLVVKGLSGVSEGFASLLSGGEFSFRSFAKSIVDSLLQMIVQFTVIEPIIKNFKSLMGGMSSGGGGGLFGALASGIGSFFGPGTIGAGFANGGAFSGGTQFFAEGGVVTRATPFGMSGGQTGVMGEAGPEAIMPLKRGADGKLGVAVSGEGADSSTYITNHITVTMGDGSTEDDREKTAKAIAAAIDKKWQENYSKATRVGGQANRVSLAI